jgi:hypothetical protein
MRGSWLAALVMLSGCAAHTPTGRLAVTEPLVSAGEVELSEAPGALPAPLQSRGDTASAVSFEETPRGERVAGPTIEGTRGAGLNVATALYQAMIAEGFEVEVACITRTRGTASYRSQVEIRFPHRLSRAQRTSVRAALAAISPESVRP